MTTSELTYKLNRFWLRLPSKPGFRTQTQTMINQSQRFWKFCVCVSASNISTLRILTLDENWQTCYLTNKQHGQTMSCATPFTGCPTMNASNHYIMITFKQEVPVFSHFPMFTPLLQNIGHMNIVFNLTLKTF